MKIEFKDRVTETMIGAVNFHKPDPVCDEYIRISMNESYLYGLYIGIRFFAASDEEKDFVEETYKLAKKILDAKMDKYFKDKYKTLLEETNGSSNDEKNIAE